MRGAIEPPAAMIPGQGVFQLDRKTLIITAGEEDLGNEAQYLAGLLRNFTGFETGISDGDPDSKSDIVLSVNHDIENAEGYQLLVEENGILIEGGSAAGLFYGIQTLRQLLPHVEAGYRGNLPVPCLEINDEPRFNRGMHLDVGRHVFPVEFIKKYIDLIALHKMNTFHWHLTEDQGWRIEIKKYPELTRVGTYRNETLVGHGRDRPRAYDGERYGGFYTQEEIKEVVDYAGNDSVFEFLEDIQDEVIALFPGKYIHIGGDECPKKSWEQCPKCQSRIRAEGLKNEHELQSYFIRRVEDFLLTRDRYIIGWDEIMIHNTYVYLNHYQANPENESLANGGFTDLEKIYHYEPLPAGSGDYDDFMERLRSYVYHMDAPDMNYAKHFLEIGDE